MPRYIAPSERVMPGTAAAYRRLQLPRTKCWVLAPASRVRRLFPCQFVLRNKNPHGARTIVTVESTTGNDDRMLDLKH